MRLFMSPALLTFTPSSTLLAITLAPVTDMMLGARPLPAMPCTLAPVSALALGLLEALAFAEAAVFATSFIARPFKAARLWNCEEFCKAFATFAFSCCANLKALVFWLLTLARLEQPPPAAAVPAL